MSFPTFLGSLVAGSVFFSMVAALRESGVALRREQARTQDLWRRLYDRLALDAGLTAKTLDPEELAGFWHSDTGPILDGELGGIRIQLGCGGICNGLDMTELVQTPCPESMGLELVLVTPECGVESPWWASDLAKVGHEGAAGCALFANDAQAARLAVGPELWAGLLALPGAWLLVRHGHAAVVLPEGRGDEPPTVAELQLAAEILAVLTAQIRSA